MRKIEYVSIDDVLDEFVPMYLGHFGSMPMSWTSIDKLLEFSLSDEYVDACVKLSKYINDADNSILSINPSQYLKIAYRFQMATKSQKSIYKRSDEIYLLLCNSSVRSRALFDTEIMNKLSLLKFHDEFEDSEKRKIAYLNSLVRGYCELLYCDEHTIGGDIFGEYAYDKNAILVRRFNELRPIEIHKEIKDFPYSEIHTYCSYENKFRFSSDIFGNLTNGESYVLKLNAWAIQTIDIDEKSSFLSPNEVDALIETLELWITKLTDLYKRKDRNQIAKIKLLCEYYSLKPLFDKVDGSWIPIYNDISTQEEGNEQNILVAANRKLMSINGLEQRASFVRELLDPRIKW